jgi:hypothetical protein
MRKTLVKSQHTILGMNVAVNTGTFVNPLKCWITFWKVGMLKWGIGKEWDSLFMFIHMWWTVSMHGFEYRYIYMDAWETNNLFGYEKNEL